MRLATFAGKLDRAAVVPPRRPTMEIRPHAASPSRSAATSDRKTNRCPTRSPSARAPPRDGRREPLVVAAGLAPRPPHVHLAHHLRRRARGAGPCGIRPGAAGGAARTRPGTGPVAAPDHAGHRVRRRGERRGPGRDHPRGTRPARCRQPSADRGRARTSRVGGSRVRRQAGWRAGSAAGRAPRRVHPRRFSDWRGRPLDS